MRNFTPEVYRQGVAMDDPHMQQFMQDEQDFIAGVEGSEAKTFVDLGAGYGRVVPLLAKVANDVIAIEINPDMYEELESQASDYDNVTAVQGDLMRIADILPADLSSPVFLILQNSLGTIENGEPNSAFKVVTEEASKRGGELLLGLFRQPALKDWGVEMYSRWSEMIGSVDMENTDFENGTMVSDTGYTSKWWTDEEIAEICTAGQVVRKSMADEYALVHLAFPAD